MISTSPRKTYRLSLKNDREKEQRRGSRALSIASESPLFMLI